jgi:ribose transport system substrate-binding protein
MQQAKEAGIPIITYDSDFDGITLQNYKDIRLAYVGTNNFELGLAFGEQLKKLRPEGGKLLIQTGRPDSPNLNLRIMGLRTALSGKSFNKPPGDMLQNDNGWTEVRSPIPNYDQINRSVKQLASFLKGNKKQGDSFVAVGGWAQDDEVSYREMIMPYKNKLINNEKIVIMSDTSVNQLAMLRDRLAHANIGQNPYEMGAQSILTLYKIVTKQPYAPVTYTSLTYCTATNYTTCKK